MRGIPSTVICNDEGEPVSFRQAARDVNISESCVRNWYKSEGLETYEELRHRNTPEGKRAATKLKGSYKGKYVTIDATNFNRNQVCYERTTRGKIIGRCKHYFNLTEAFLPDIPLPETCKAANKSCVNFDPEPVGFSDISSGESPVKNHLSGVFI